MSRNFQFYFTFFFSQSSDQTCATLVVDDHVVSQVTENPESDAVIVLNPSCSAFKTPESKITVRKVFQIIIFRFFKDDLIIRVI